MKRHTYYHVCQNYRHKVVRIKDRAGRIHIGRITEVTDEGIVLEPVQQKFRGGFGYGPRFDDDEEYYGYDNYNENYNYNYNYNNCNNGNACGNYYGQGAYGLAFGFIFGIALASLFFF